MTDVIIIGAPRSGTNMLRDVLTARPGVVTWPCDEINAIWRHGSYDYPTDEIPVDRADDDLRWFIHRRFERVRRKQRGVTVVEKTCANSLRVGYVAALRPAARFVLITRDGVDAAGSAAIRWNAPRDWRYTARKARYVPTGDLARTAVSFVTQQISTRGHREDGRTGTWGPRFAGMDEALRSHSLEEVCALQWRRCVELSHAVAETLPAARVYRMTYEDFVARPREGLVDVLEFLGLPSDDPGPAVARVSASSVGKGRSRLDPDQLARVESIVAPTLRRLSHA